MNPLLKQLRDALVEAIEYGTNLPKCSQKRCRAVLAIADARLAGKPSKVWRILKEDEIVQEGDFFSNNAKRGWHLVSASIGSYMQKTDVGHFRRRIKPRK